MIVQPTPFQLLIARIQFWAVRHHLWDKLSLVGWAIGGGMVGLLLAMLQRGYPQEMEGVLVALPVVGWLVWVMVISSAINREDWYGHAPGKPASVAFIMAALRFAGPELAPLLRAELAKRVTRKRAALGRYDVTDVLELVLHQHKLRARPNSPAAKAQRAALGINGDQS